MKIYNNLTNARKYAKMAEKKNNKEYKIFTMRDLFNNFFYIVSEIS